MFQTLRRRVYCLACTWKGSLRWIRDVRQPFSRLARHLDVHTERPAEDVTSEPERYLAVLGQLDLVRSIVSTCAMRENCANRSLPGQRETDR